MGDFGEVAHDLSDLPGQFAGIMNSATPEAIQEALTPLSEGNRTGVERRLILRQQQIELSSPALRGARRKVFHIQRRRPSLPMDARALPEESREASPRNDSRWRRIGIP